MTQFLFFPSSVSLIFSFSVSILILVFGELAYCRADLHYTGGHHCIALHWQADFLKVNCFAQSICSNQKFFAESFVKISIKTSETRTNFSMFDNYMTLEPVFPVSLTLIQNFRRFSNSLRNRVIAWLQLLETLVTGDMWPPLPGPYVCLYLPFKKNFPYPKPQRIKWPPPQKKINIFWTPKKGFSYGIGAS